MSSELDPPPPGVRQRDVFLAALEKADAKERAAFLVEACGKDSQLLRRIQELLREQEGMGDFMIQPAVSAPPPGPGVGPTGTEVVAMVTEKPGDLIGRYKLLQKIGEGGCGVVYMAEQETPVRRRVALKIIKLGMDTRQVIARFEAERQAIAMMDHPNIAKVLDAGATDTGRPYFVMELVRGIKITEYSDQNNLTTAQRLRLFTQVSQAVQHAHQKGIIHRDIKPSNIMVTLHDGTPVPKVIDFGVAKATNQQRLTNQTVFTAFEQFIGTPAYMSPEQAEMSGLDIDTRSDIYSLGVLLYELLTGRTPFDPETLANAGLDEVRRTIRNEEPERPSNRLATLVEADLTTTAERRGTEAPRLISLLEGDLDWVVMRCLEKDRTRRYATASELVADVERYLEGQPVLARPPSTVYRLQKMVRRHRGAFTAAALIAVTLVTGATISTWQAIRARKAEIVAHASQQNELLLRREAENGWLRAREKGALARLNEYIASINLSHQSLLAGNYGRAVQLLSKLRPAAGEADLRGFEWRYLWQLSQGDSHTSMPSQDGPVQGITFSPDGMWLVILGREKLNINDARSRSLLTSLPGSFGSVVFSHDGKQMFTAPAWGGMHGPGRERGAESGVRVWLTADWAEEKTLPRASGPLSLSADGQFLATGGREGVHIWRTSDWQLTRLIRQASSPLAFSPDGGLLVTDSRPGAPPEGGSRGGDGGPRGGGGPPPDAKKQGINIWNLAGDENASPVILEDSDPGMMRGPWLRAESSYVFTPDGLHIIGSRNVKSDKGVFIIAVWDAVTGREEAVMPEDPDHIEHTGSISCLGITRDGRVLATGSLDHSVRLWSLSSHRWIATFQGHLNEVWALAISPDGRTIVTGAKDGGVKVWPTRPFPKDEFIAGIRIPLAFSPDSRTLAAISSSNTLAFINVATRQIDTEFDLTPPRFGMIPVSVSRDLRTVAEALEDGTVKLLNTSTHESYQLKAADRPLRFITLSPDGRLLLTAGFRQPLRCWDLNLGTNVMLAAECDGAYFSPDSRWILAAGSTNSLQLFEVRTGALRRTLTMESAPGFHTAFSPDGRLVAVATGPSDVEQSIYIWELETGKLLGTCTGHKQAIWSVTFSPDSRTLASASDDGTLKLWNVSTQQELLSKRNLGGAQFGLLFSPDGKMLVCANNRPMDAGVRVYRAPSMTEVEAHPLGPDAVQ